MMIHDEDEMRVLGARIAKKLEIGDIICLNGDLGVGKSVLARAIIRSKLGAPELDVPSPSFALMLSYGDDPVIWHLDLYRLGSIDELLELGIEETFMQSITLIEWSERLGEMLPTRRLEIEITDQGGERRQVDFGYHGHWNWQI